MRASICSRDAADFVATDQVTFRLLSMMSGGGRFTVEISGISESSISEIQAHFQKKKYGEGEVTVTSLEDGKAVMVIEGLTPESKVIVLTLLVVYKVHIIPNNKTANFLVVGL